LSFGLGSSVFDWPCGIMSQGFFLGGKCGFAIFFRRYLCVWYNVLVLKVA
jgi:hypothetical protein